MRNYKAEIEALLACHPALLAELDRLYRADATLENAYAAGVDNWEGWGSWHEEDEDEDE